MTKQPNVSELHSAACKLYEAGFSVIPLVHGRKRPAVSWEQYQHRRATINEINSWWSARNATNPYGLGTVTGSVSGNAVLDIDPARGHTARELIAEAEEVIGNKFPATCCVSTCGDSYHMYFKTTAPIPTVIVYQSPAGKIELRGEGAVVAMPPTVAYSDRTSTMGQYAYITPLSDRIALENTWIYGFALEKKQARNGPPPSDAPSEAEIEAVVAAYLPLLPQTIKDALTGKDVPVDRSKQCYYIACELARAGIRDQHTLATIILAVPCHQQKYGPRPKDSAWGEWGHALTIAERALEEVSQAEKQRKTGPKKTGNGNGSNLLQQPPFPFVLVPLSKVTPEQPQFLINPYLPRGEATIFDGDPGEGKTWVWMAFAAGLTGSKICPVPYDYQAKKDAKIAVLTVEDSISKTVRNRLEWLGANLARIFVFVPDAAVGNGAVVDAEQPTVEYAEQAIESIRQIEPDMVVIDPITLYAATEKNFNSDRATDVRKMLMRLTAAARQLNFALVLCRHYRKAAGKAIHRGVGSIDFSATVRSVLSFGLDSATGEKICVHTKSNLTAKGPALAFALNENDVPPFRWLGTKYGINPDIITGDTAANEAADEKSKLDEAVSYCQEMLKDGPVLAQTMIEKGRKLGISERTMRRARDKLGVKSYSTGFGSDKKFYWTL